jgi:NAD(P)H-flavin reductase
LLITIFQALNIICIFNILKILRTLMLYGAGKCCYSKVGGHYMCVDGPVFNYEEMMALPPEY